MLKTILNKIFICFSSPKQALKTAIFLLIPILTFFLVLSDRTPYNSFCLVFYGLETILILIYVTKYHHFIFDFFAKMLLAFLFCILLSQILNFKLFEFPRTIVLLSIFSFIFYQFVATLNGKEKERIYKLLICGGLIFLTYFVFYYFKELIHLNFGDRLGRDFSDQNDLAKNLSLFGIMSEILLIKVSNKKKFFYIFTSISFFFFILVTGSISNLLTFTLCSCFVFIFGTRGKKRFIVIISIIISIILFVVSLQFPFMKYFKTRLVNMLNSFSSNSGTVDYSFVDRFSLAIYAFKLFFSKPMFGYGYDQVQFYTFDQNTFSHNNFAELLASFGILGFLVFETIILYPLFKSIKAKKNGLVIGTLSYLFVFQFFLIIFRKKIEYFLLPLAFSSIDLFGNSYTLKLTFKKGNYIENGGGCFNQDEIGYDTVDI